MGAHLGGPAEMKSWVVVMVWVGLNLNPHPFKKTKACGTQGPRRIWKWDVMHEN